MILGWGGAPVVGIKRGRRSDPGGATVECITDPHVRDAEANRSVEPGKKIVLYPHPAPRHPAKPLSAIDAEVRRYAGRMLELMYEHKGLGLAAPQIALPVQLLVMNFDGDPERKDLECVAVNPVIMDR